MNDEETDLKINKDKIIKKSYQKIKYLRFHIFLYLINMLERIFLLVIFLNYREHYF